MALRNITQSLKTIAGDATKIATLEREILGFLPSASKKEFLEVANQIAEANAFTQPVWDLVQNQYLQRYDDFTAEDTLAFYDVVSRCPLDVYRNLDEKLWTSLVYLGKKEAEKYALNDPGFEEKLDTVFQGAMAQELKGTIIPMIKPDEDIFDDTTSNVEIITRERRPEDIENRIDEILGLEGLEVENYNPALEKIWTEQLEEDEQIALWESLLEDKKSPKLVSKGAKRISETETKKIPDPAPSKKQ